MALYQNNETAHPRVGGENCFRARMAISSAGSSPRGRGKPRPCRGAAEGGQAHPRVGGENYVPTGNSMIREGSSPRGRGKRAAELIITDSDGLIPAWAGKTPMALRCEPSAGAHPRVGGENGQASAAYFADQGSSPRGRGKLEVRLRRGRGLGLIPAWAGKTCQIVSQFAARPAHPRVGGENFSSPASELIDGGSSPRGRGKPLRDSVLGVPRRLIPAWAGKTSHGPRRTA